MRYLVTPNDFTAVDVEIQTSTKRLLNHEEYYTEAVFEYKRQKYVINIKSLTNNELTKHILSVVTDLYNNLLKDKQC